MENQMSLDQLRLAQEYLTQLKKAGYELVDLNIVEPYNPRLEQMETDRIIFERNQQLYTLRSDWTQSLMTYNASYDILQDKVCYFGPVIRNYQTTYQAGVELYHPNEDEMLEAIRLHLTFVENWSQKRITTIIVNDETLLNQYLEKYQLSSEAKGWVVEKDLSSMKESLGVDHPLYQLMITPVSRQFDKLNGEFPDSSELNFIYRLKQEVNTLTTRFILDLSYRPPQTYYNGFYFQAFLDENQPVLTGGEYDSEAFGIGLDLSKGGLL